MQQKKRVISDDVMRLITSKGMFVLSNKLFEVYIVSVVCWSVVFSDKLKDLLAPSLVSYSKVFATPLFYMATFKVYNNKCLR